MSVWGPIIETHSLRRLVGASGSVGYRTSTTEAVYDVVHVDVYSLLYRATVVGREVHVDGRLETIHLHDPRPTALTTAEWQEILEGEGVPRAV